MKVLFTLDAIETDCIFLAGPTYENCLKEKSWRPEALDILKRKGYKGTVFVPENWDFNLSDIESRTGWEIQAMEKADCILFWIPRNLIDMQGFTTNIEFGEFYRSGKVVLGAPEDAAKMELIETRCSMQGIIRRYTLEDTINDALTLIAKRKYKK